METGGAPGFVEPERYELKAARHGQRPCPSAATVPSQGVPGGSGWLDTLSQGEPGPLGAQPLPRVLKRAASKAAHFTAFDHAGGAQAAAPDAVRTVPRHDAG